MFKKVIIIALLVVMPVAASSQNAQGQKAKTPKVGIFLSGGGALGFAHIGALKALEEVGIHPDYIAGASMGALVGVFYAYGYTPDEISRMVIDKELYSTKNILAISGKNSDSRRLGVFSHKKVRELLEHYIPTDSFNDLKKEMTVVVSNLSKSRTEWVNSGDSLTDYVLASMSIPCIFEPILMNGDIYIDGGCFNHFPSYVIRDKVDILIGVEVMPYTDTVQISKIADVLTRYFASLAVVSSSEGHSQCDHLCVSHAIDKYKMLDFSEFTQIYDYGYQSMKQYIEEHPSIIRDCRGR